MIKLNNQVRERVWDQMQELMFKQVLKSVREQALTQDEVLNRVRLLVWVRVYDQVWRQARRLLD